MMTRKNLTEITKENFQLEAARCYQKRLCISTQAFLNDLRALEFKSDLTRYLNSREPKLIRILINKIIVAINLFGPTATEFILFRLEKAEIQFSLMEHILSKLDLLKYPIEVNEDFKREIDEATKF